MFVGTIACCSAAKLIRLRQDDVGGHARDDRGITGKVVGSGGWAEGEPRVLCTNVLGSTAVPPLPCVLPL